MAKVAPVSRRKADHIQINLERDVASSRSSGLERFRFDNAALPELDLKAVRTDLTFLGRRLGAPLLISSMTGGTEAAGRLNLALAQAAQAAGAAMGLGSLRAALEDPSLAPTFQVRRAAPDILLLANLGAVQLNYGYGPDQCRRAVDMVEADALVLHLNALQEALQPEGDTDFSGLLSKIEQVCASLSVPVIAKEVGWGISAGDARRLVQAGVAAIDVAGAGGTSWSQVEMYRTADPEAAALAASFVGWGIPTADAVRQVREALPTTPLIASGGLRSGTDIAKAIALGADLGAMAGPFLKAAAESSEAVKRAIDQVVAELRLVMFATGSGNLAALRKAHLEALP
ncbi:MAG TPA: type 2 isopentenyl-diphosphate Delta-isomerase [Anaerolineales bacterium]|nr:type 2 isopentenyl-diphosphate Delta-isomerase [Anaerolineales bacterium]